MKQNTNEQDYAWIDDKYVKVPKSAFDLAEEME